jgi:hypothetical protein
VIWVCFIVYSRMDDIPNNTSNSNTHTWFFKIMTPRKLNELLLRASGKNSILQRDINARLRGLNVGYAEVKLVKEIEEGEEVCSLYVNFKNHNNHKQFGHVTFHFDKKRNTKYKKNGLGRFHTKNNRNNTGSFLRVTRNSEKTFITMSLSNYPSILQSDLKQCVDKSLEVLNLYFNPGSNLYLRHHNPNIPLRNHECLSRIINVLKVNNGSLQHTRKTIIKDRYLLSKQDSASSQSRSSNPWGKISALEGTSVDSSSK